MFGLGVMGSQDKVDRADSGTGVVHQRTVEFADTAIAVHNIATMTIIDGKRDPTLAVVGGALVLVGLGAFAISAGMGVLFLLMGGALIYWCLNRPLDVFLSIGTSDSRAFHLVSRDKRFLVEVRTFLRQKIDENNLQTATINISAGTITGGLAIGANAQAAGQDGRFHNGV